MSKSDFLRNAWSDYECKRSKLVKIEFAGDQILVAKPTIDAWKALERVLMSFGYEVKIEKTDSYNCRNIKGSNERSLHSYGIAIDINWHTNPFIDHAGIRKPRFSDADDQKGRAQDVKLGKADTDMSRDMVQAVLDVKTNDGDSVFGWGGDWRGVKDAMHFQIELTPDQLKSGIDWTTVPELVGAPKSQTYPFIESKDQLEGAVMGLPAEFYDHVRDRLFGSSLSQSAVDNLNEISSYFLGKYPDNPINQLAYIMATVLAEVGRNMAPVREGFAKDDAAARRAVKRLAVKRGPNSAVAKYAQPLPPHGHVYYGRGYVQLTWKKNYEVQGDRLGINLVENPDLALETEVAIDILVNGMMSGAFNRKGYGLAYYVNESKQDFKEARRTVNVLDRAEEIAGYAQQFLDALEAGNVESFDAAMPVMAGQAQTIIDYLLESEKLAASSLVQKSQFPPAPAKPSPMSTDGLAIPKVGTLDPAQLNVLVEMLESAGLVDRKDALTPVNAILGETIGKLLNGWKTGIGVGGILVSIFLPQLAPLLTVFSEVATSDNQQMIVDKVLVRDVQDILMPIASILAAWGGLGKVDKSLHRSNGSVLANLLKK